jgi:hypothetical protein
MQTLPEEAVVPAAASILAKAASVAEPFLPASQKAVWAERHHPRALLEARAVQLMADSVSAGARAAPLTLAAWQYPMALILCRRQLQQEA